VRRNPTWPLVLLVSVLAGCGGDRGSELDDVLRYYPSSAGAVAVASTDLGNDQWRTLDRGIVRPLSGGLGIEEGAADAANEAGISFRKDVKPLLGGPLALGTPAHVSDPEQPFLAVMKTGGSTKRLRTVLRKLDFTKNGTYRRADLYTEGDPGDEATLAVDGDVLVVADSDANLRRAVDRARGDHHFDEQTFEAPLRGLPDDALLRVALRGDDLVRGRGFGVSRFRGVPWFDSIFSAGLTLGLDDGRLVLDGAVNTYPHRITDADLPVAPGNSAPPLVTRAGQVAGASRNQSQSTVFLLRAARRAYPRSRFVRDVATLENALHIDFAEEILRQFNGPSASLLAPSGAFAARSAVRDPVRLALQLRRLAPSLGRLVEDLQGLGSRGLVLLGLFAPDAPVSHSVLRSSRVDVGHLAGSPNLYRLTGLRGPGPDELVFGLVGKTFVVATDERRARDIATARARTPSGAKGSMVASGDARLLEPVLRDLGAFQGEGVLVGTLKPFSGFVASIRASRAQLRGTVRVALRSLTPNR
jgi:uncharacterized protein DUF3352